MAKFLITGGAGFIGNRFLSTMLEKYPDNEFVVIDSLTYASNYSLIKKYNNLPNFRFYKADITNKEEIFSIFDSEQFDIVVNFAAETHVDRSIINQEIFYKTNVFGTLVLLEASLKYKIKRFHQVSTDEVYGDLSLDSKKEFSEDDPVKPSNPYSASKAAADLLALSFYRTFDLPVTISRCSNNFGPNQTYDKLIPLIIISAYEGKKIPLYGDGTNVRDWIYVDDHCKAIDLIINKGRAGEIYNISTHNLLSNIEIAKIILSELGKTEDSITFTKDRLGHDKKYALSSIKLEEELEFTSDFDFKESLKNTVSNYIDLLKKM